MVQQLGHELLGEPLGNPPSLARALNKVMAHASAPPVVLRVHRWLYERSDGRIGHGMTGTPTLLLRTTGRTTGLRRTSALCYVRDAEHVVVAASNAGARQAPAWYHNLVSDPSVEIQLGRRRTVGHAVVVGPSDPDYERLWKLMNEANNSRYDWYQAKTSRPIPLVVVTPADQAAGALRESFVQHQQRLLEHYRVDAVSRFVEIAAPPMRVHVLDAGQGEPVVVLHGGDGEAVDWAPLMAVLQDRVRLFAVDRPGFGLTDGFDYRDIDLRRHAGDFVVSTLDALGLEAATLMGGSMGGFFALAAALDHPARVRALVLVGYPAGLVRAAPLGQRVLAAFPPLTRRVLRADAKDVQALRARYQKVFHLDADSVPPMYFETRAAGMRLPGSVEAFASSLHRLAGLRGYRRDAFLGNDAARVSQPTLIIWGQHDMAAAATGRAAAQQMPNATFVSLDGIGHFPFAQDPDRTAELITEFLDCKVAGND